MTKQENNLTVAFQMFPDYSYKQIAQVMGIPPCHVAILRNSVNRKGGTLHSRHISG